MIRKILAPVRNDGKGDNVLRHAATLARGSGAHIEVAHCRARPQDLMPYGVPIPEFLRRQIVEQTGEVADEEERRLRADLEVLAGELDLDITGAAGTPGHPSVSFAEDVGKQVDIIKRRGRLADVIAVAKPDKSRNLGTNTLKAAVFHSGRPVMMCPPRAENDAPETLGERIALAWNGSSEAARALAQSRPMLADAKQVWVLSNGSDAGPGTTAADVLEYLVFHGVHAEIVDLPPGGTVGPALLAAVERIGADLLVMGAYGDSHERETLLGGNTQTIVDHATTPVVFSH